MKKWIALVLAALMLVSVFAACGKNNETPATTENNGTVVSNADPVLSGDLAAIIDAIYAIAPTPLPVGTMAIDLADEYALTAFTGLSDATPVKEAAVSESMMGSQGYSVVLVRLNNPADAVNVANGMADGIDQRKWICACADSLRVVAFNDLVLLVMIDSQLDIKVNTLIDAFASLCGGEAFSMDVDRTVNGSTPAAPAEVDLKGDMATIIDGIYAISPTPLPVMTMPVDLNDEYALPSFTGLTDKTPVKEAVVSESMMGAQGYSVVLVRLNDATDAETVAKAMAEGINTRKWICVSADDLRVVACDDLVLLVMIDPQLDVKTDNMIAAFGQLCGKDFTVDIKK